VASTKDFTYSGIGDKRDQRLDAMRKALPNFDDSDPVSVVAGVLFLDQAAGKAERLHHVLIQPALLPWLLMMVRIDDAKIRELMAAADVDLTDEQIEALDAQLTPLTVDQPFEVTFASTDPEIPTEAYPEIVRGKTIKLQVMTLEQAGEHYFFAATVDAEGNLIELDRPVKL
jgi:hypothetical protein